MSNQERKIIFRKWIRKSIRDAIMRQKEEMTSDAFRALVAKGYCIHLRYINKQKLLVVIFGSHTNWYNVPSEIWIENGVKNELFETLYLKNNIIHCSGNAQSTEPMVLWLREP